MVALACVNETRTRRTAALVDFSAMLTVRTIPKLAAAPIAPLCMSTRRPSATQSTRNEVRRWHRAASGRADTSRGGLLAFVLLFDSDETAACRCPDDDRDPHRHGHRARHTNEGQLCCGRSLRGPLTAGRAGSRTRGTGRQSLDRHEPGDAVRFLAVRLDGPGDLVLEIQNTSVRR